MISPMKLILVDCLTVSDHINPFSINVGNIGILATLPNAVVQQPIALNVPKLVMTVQIALLSQVHVLTLVTPIKYFIRASLPVSLNVR